MPKNHIKMFCPLKPCTQRYTIIGYDTEDNGQGAPDNFLCCCFYNKDEQKTFTNKEEARQYLFSRKFPTPLFVAHNLAYDLNNLDYPYGSIETLYAKSRMIGATYKKGKYKVKHIDSGNFYIGTSIENLGMIIGFSKIKFDVIKLRDKIFMELPPLIASDMLKYCMRDAEITYRVTEKLQDMCAKYGVKLSCFTGASLALKIFRTKFLKISIKPRGKQINSYERLSYYGGRTEVFDYNRHPKVSYIDINSSYPFQMKTKKIPHPSTYEIRKNITQEELLKHHGIALITINIPKMRIPPLPYRTELKLLFPYGKITGCWTIPEIQLALDVGCTIETIHEAVIYYETIDLFSEYVDEFYTLKNSSYGIEKEFYKLLLNGLSGKFGERRTNTYRGIINNLKLCSCAVTYDNKIRNPLSDGWFCSKCNNVHIDGNDIDSMPKEDWISIQCSKSKDTTHTFPIIIAYITAHGRIQLYKQLIQAHSIYCDTDSVVGLNDNGATLGNELGEWKEDILYDFKALLPKVYNAKTDKCKNRECPKYDTHHYHEINKIKGVPKQTTTEPYMIDVIRNSKLVSAVRYEFDRPLKLAEAIRRHTNPNKWIPDKKDITGIDTKRTQLPNGDSEPVYINDTRDIKCFDDLLRYLGEINDIE